MNIGFRENMTVEFKSDLKKLSDDVIIESVVAFANTDGGKFFRLFCKCWGRRKRRSFGKNQMRTAF